MFCNKCGKELAEGTAFCPSCGASQSEAIAQPAYSAPGKAPASTNTMCVVGLVISGISLLINFWGIVGIIGTIVSVIGLQNCTKNGEKGKGLAITGIVIGVISILWACLALLAFSGIL